MRKDKPSRTAYKVALNVLTLGAKPGMEKILPSGIVDATARLLIVSGVVGNRTVRLSRSRRMVSVYKAFDWMLPGQFEAFAYRKAFCESQVRNGIDSGAAQILVLGAGYDTLGWRLAPEYPGVGFFEIDHPATARLKARGIDRMGSRNNLCLIAEDLGKRKLKDVLGGSGLWDPLARTVFVAEGLVMYLQPTAVRDLFRQCTEISGPGSRFAFSYIPSSKNGLPDAGRWTGLMLRLQKFIGEPWLWSILPEKLGDFLKETGWTYSQEQVGTQDQYGVEIFCVATK